MTFQGPLSARKVSMPNKFASGVLFDSARIDSLRDAIAADTLRPRVKTKWNTVMAYPSVPWTVEGNFDPWDIPENYSDNSETNQEMLLKFHNDTRACAAYAFRYAVNGNANDAERVALILSAYGQIDTFMTNAGSTLNWFDGWGLLIQSALMIQNSAAYTAQVEFSLKNAVTRALATLEPIAYTRNNNWAAWGLAMEIAAASFLGDRGRFDRALYRWRDLFNDTVKSGYLVQNGGPANGQIKNNVAVREIYRMGGSQGNGAYGLLYSAFHLDGLVVAAEYARLNGEWLYDHVSPDGSSLEGFWHEIAYMKRYGAPSLSANYLDVQWFNTSNLADPESNYYYSGYYTNRVGASFYILQELWPDQAALEIMHGGFMTVAVPPGTYPPAPEGSPSVLHTGVPILQDYYGMYGADLAYSDRPLYG